MATPFMHNCEHQGEGWCLDCVAKLHTEVLKWRGLCERVCDAHDGKDDIYEVAGAIIQALEE